MPFSVTACQQTALLALSIPPPPHVVRPVPVGELVYRCYLPLELLPTQNATRGAKGWAVARIRKQCFELMWLQNGCKKQEQPLTGRPMVICVRFSATEPDKYSNFAKIAVDRLGPDKVRKGKVTPGLGYIVDDAPRFIDLHEYWEPAKRGAGFGMISVYLSETG